MVTLAKQTISTVEPVPVKLAGTIDVAGRAKEVHERIARRAYALYEGRGHVHGHDGEDWLQAESEIHAPLFVGFIELDGHLRVEVGVTAAELPELQVGIEPWRLVISGKRMPRNGPAGQPCPGRTGGPPERAEIFQVVDLPVPVEPSGAAATYANGLLRIMLPKLAGNKASPQQAVS
jgi:HSP20 family molecular chaperone IbpA